MAQRRKFESDNSSEDENEEVSKNKSVKLSKDFQKLHLVNSENELPTSFIRHDAIPSGSRFMCKYEGFQA